MELEVQKLKNTKQVSDIGEEELETIRSEMRKKFSTTFGNRVSSITTGGAPTAPEVIEFLKKTFGAFVFNSYGTTEAGGISYNGKLSSSATMKLIDLPELGYTSVDLPFPRGEIVVKTNNQGSGYYKEEELSKLTWTEDGFIRTGDIGVQEPDGSIHVLTRIKNVSKLSQGEFVDPDKLESIGLACKFIDQIYIDVNSLKEFLVAVVVPIFENLVEYLLAACAPENNQFAPFQSRNFQTSPFSAEEKTFLANLPQCKQLILSELRKLAEENQLLSFEYVQEIFITPEVFTIENGLQTSSNKLCRHKIAKHYEKEIANLYNSFEFQQQNHILVQIEEFFTEIFQKAKQGSENESVKNKSFLSLGGDSLSALNLIHLIDKRFRIEIPLELLYNDEQNTPESIASKILKIKNQPEGAKTEPKRNESDNKDIQEDLKLAEELKLNYEATEAPNTSNHVFLTGASGFIGMFLLETLLKDNEEENTVYCLLRAYSAQDKHLFVEKLRKANIELTPTQIERLQILPGDLSKPNFGLDESEFHHFARLIDKIYHCGAHVNHLLSYTHLRGSNVIVRFPFPSLHSILFEIDAEWSHRAQRMSWIWPGVGRRRNCTTSAP